MTHNANSTFIFWPNVFLYGTTIAYGVLMTSRFRITNMSLESKVKVNLLKICNIAFNLLVLHFHFWLKVLVFGKMIIYGV